MIVRALRSVSLIVCILASGRATPALPLQDGERLTYRVSFAIVPGAGEIKIAANQDTSAPNPQLIVTTTTATRKLARMLLPFDAEAKSIFDLKTGKLLSLQETSKQRDKRSEHSVTFDHTARQATYVGSDARDKPRLLPIPTGNPTDLIMGLLQTRSWDLKPGQKGDLLVLFDDDFYELTIHMARYEDVQTAMGMFKTVVLEPRMDKTPPKGMFKRGSSVRVWIAQDKHRLPVKFEVEFKIGTGTAMLESYEPPSIAPPPDAKDPRS